MGIIMRKPVFRVSDMLMLKQAYSATQTSITICSMQKKTRADCQTVQMHRLVYAFVVGNFLQQINPLPHIDDF